MILVTGGRGAVATSLLPLLVAGGHEVRVGSKDPRALGRPDAVLCDLTDPDTFPAALAGVSSVFLYAEASHIADFVAAATRAGVEHIVLLSSVAALDPRSANLLATSHRDVETALLASPIASTILRPGAFATNAKAWAWPIRAGRPVALAYPGAYTAPIHEKDLAEVAHAALTDPRHRDRHYTLTGPETMTFAAQVERIAEVTGLSITVERVAPEQWKQIMSGRMPAAVADGLLAYWRASDGVPSPVSPAVEEVTGHPGRTFTAWVRDHLADFATTS
jgi:uncharacterized protein YbjT (DUF2867 family)